MKAKVLVNKYNDGTDMQISRLYFEPDFEQADKDLKLLNEHPYRQWSLQDVEIYSDKNYTLDKTKKPITVDVLLEKRLIEFDELSVRALNTFKIVEVYTLKELIQYSEATWMKQRFMGKRTMKELKEFLSKYNLKLPEKDLK